MTHSVRSLTEHFLTEYFLFEAVFGDFINDDERRSLFDTLAGEFQIPAGSEMNELYETLCSEHFKAIKDLASYERTCRLIEYAEQSGQSPELTAIDRMLLAKKGEAMMIKNSIFEQAKNLTVDMIVTVLNNTATNGNIHSMTALAYMEYHGLFVDEDKTNGMKRFKYCARWNNLFGILMCIRFGDEKERCLDILGTVMHGTDKKAIYEYVKKRSDGKKDFETDETAKLIEKAFGFGIIKRAVYDRVFAGVAFSEIISIEDKRRILLNKQKDAIASLSEIPFGVCEKGLTIDYGCFDRLPVHRPAETEPIKRNIKIAAECPAGVYKPLLLICSDRFVTDMYAKTVYILSMKLVPVVVYLLIPNARHCRSIDEES